MLTRSPPPERFPPRRAAPRGLGLAALVLGASAAPAWAKTAPASPATATPVAAPAPVAPDAPTADTAVTDDDSLWALHGQATVVGQGVGGFRSPYAGDNSLTPRQVKETVDLTAYVGLRPWQGGELWANPEIDQGFGLSNTLGAAGFTSAEAYKVGQHKPYLKLQRAFFRQTAGLGGEREAVDGAANQFRGARDKNRLVFTVGKFGVGDVFDTNSYAHDPRGDFLNWALVDAGSFDYAADAWGYSTGAAVEWYQGAWTLRTGAFNLSTVPNGKQLEKGFQQFQVDAEAEHRHTLAGRPGAVRLTLFRNRGNFGRFDEALAATQAQGAGDAPDLAAVRRRQSRVGASVNGEQALTDNLGVFARAGIADGQVEPYDFTDIDRTGQVGLALKGSGWGRAEDTVGVAGVVNGISAEHKQFLAAGGLGVLVGDGRLPHPGNEAIAEAYYKVHVTAWAELTADYQLVIHPGYNKDRGPAHVFAVRAHAAF